MDSCVYNRIVYIYIKIFIKNEEERLRRTELDGAADEQTLLVLADVYRSLDQHQKRLELDSINRLFC